MTASANDHAIAMAKLIRDLNNAAHRLSAYWSDNDLPGDYFDETTGYPFAESLDEVAARIGQWFDAATDRIVEEPPTPPAKGEHRKIEVVVSKATDEVLVHMKKKATGVDVHEILVAIEGNQPVVYLNGDEMFIPPLSNQ